VEDTVTAPELAFSDAAVPEEAAVDAEAADAVPQPVNREKVSAPANRREIVFFI
jgi:hypothetical protein